MDLNNVRAIHTRAEELARDPNHRETYDFAVSRAVAGLAVLAELCLPFVEPGGYFLAWKGQKAVEEINKGGGVLGRPLKIITRDSKLNPEYALRETKDMVINDKVFWVVMHVII